ncbi:patatin-like phospholipase family protein [Bacteroidales bacterium OttesenSCG-928-I21]|nr:patatin-like phospholipase family protein [Bacteroidales bacterium OttesenSCG-928-I21]
MFKIIIKKTFILSIFITLFCYYSQSQSIGLVLSGGGAKGVAHVGVIRALEENNIPIDYIVGTSMGAIIGGLYATGLSPDEIEALLKDPKFFNYYKGLIPENYKYYYKKQTPDASLLRLALYKKDGATTISLPTNFISTQPLDFGMMEFFAQSTASSGRNFNCLFVPFRCVGADIYNNKETVFSQGDLGLAIRASMTFPFFFKPVEIDNTLYFDGGIYNNFPMDVMRNEFNPDITIGVVVSSYIDKPNPDDLMLQIESLIMGEEKEYSVPSDEGYTIKIDFKDIGLLDFDKVDEFSELGYNACELIIDSLKNRMTQFEDKESLNFRRQIYKQQQPELIFDNINISGVNERTKTYVKKSFSQKSNKLNISQLEWGYYKLIADPQIETAFPTATYNDSTGYFTANFKINKDKKANVLFGASISSGYSNQLFLGFNYKLIGRTSILLNTNAYLGRLYSSFNLGSRIDIPFSTPFAIDIALTTNKFDFFKSNTRIFSLDNKPAYIVNYDNNMRIDFITPISRSSVVKLGYSTGSQTYNYFQVKNYGQNDTADHTRFNFNTLHLSLVNDNHNFIQYPNKGAKNLVSFRYVNGKEKNTPGSTTNLTDIYEQNISWIQCQILSDSYISVSKYFSIGFYGELMLSNKPLSRNYLSSLLSVNAFTPTPHSSTIFLSNYRATSFLGLGIKPIILFSEKINLRIEAYGFVPYQKILSTEPYPDVYFPALSEKFAYIHFMGTANLVYNTRVGPISFSVNYYKAETVKTYFLFHFGYMLYNKKGFDY